ncbi:DUF6825 family protein [Leptolyngbya sp. AN02str]|uniref:DUF6825 family protein n=1 Tax=Leptolyngbya sp. AN02str TaxID=3423363 RepID=UPI003D31C7DE
MKSPLVHAFFVGRALAEAIGEQTERFATTALSELGKFDAEQRERLRVFADQVLEKAARDEELATQTSGSSPSAGFATPGSTDLQATIDELRAEIAQLRTDLQRYRTQAN